MYNKKMFKEYKDRLFLFESIASTNDFLKKNDKKNAICLSDAQTMGRGRLGRSFQSEKGKGIYISFALNLSDFGSDAVSVTAFSAVEVCRTIQSVCSVTPAIKWVNDILIDNKKVCGILAELCADKIILGIGINVSNEREDFEEEIQNKAASIKMQTGKSVQREELVLELIKNIDLMAKNAKENRQKYYDFYKKHCKTLGKQVTVTVDGEDLQGTAEDIGEDFSLTVRLADNTKKQIFYGEAVVKNLY